MFKWFSDLFVVPPLFTASWVAIPELKLSFDVLVGELHFGNGQSVKLGSRMSDLASLGPPDNVDAESPFIYTEHGLVLGFTDEVIDWIEVNFQQGPPPTLLASERLLAVSGSSDMSNIVTLFGPPRKTDMVFTSVEYQVAEGVYAEWNFDDGKLSYVTFSDLGADLDEDEVEDEETW